MVEGGNKAAKRRVRGCWNFKSKLMGDEILIEFEAVVELALSRSNFFENVEDEPQVWYRLEIKSINKRFTSISRNINHCPTYQFFFVSCLRLSFHSTWLPNPWCALSVIWLWAWLKLMMPQTFALDSRQAWFIAANWARLERWQYATQRQWFDALEVAKLTDDGRL